MTGLRHRQVSGFAFAKILLLVVGYAAMTTLSPAQTLTTLHNFCAQFPCSDGSTPYAPVVQGTDGNFYGVTNMGGDHQIGVVYKITPSGTLTVLHSFGSGGDGAVPYGGLIQASDGNFYGTTQAQGVNGRGTIFKITPAGVLTTIHDFLGSDGSKAYGELLQWTDGNFYGTTFQGGAGNGGSVYKITPSGTLTTLYSFCVSPQCLDGLEPRAGLVLGTDGNFYGTTLGGGTNGGYGTIFKITPAGVLTTLHSFASSDGSYPYGALVLGSDGNFYGTTQSGGPNSHGTIFKITPAGTFTSLHNFSGSDGYGPFAGLIQAGDGNFYGVTGSDTGTIFRITPGGSYTTLFRFDFSNGGFPYAPLIQATDGNFYGTTSSGGTGSEGTVFRFTGPALIPTTTTLTTAPNPSHFGQNVVMTATVHAQSGTPGGNVEFKSDGMAIGTVGLSNGVAVLNYSALSMGTHSIVAVYQGGDGYAGSTSNTVQHVVQMGLSTTTVMSVPNPSTFGQQVTITATIGPSGPPAPTGTVSFTSNGSAIPGCTTLPLNSSMAVCMTSSLAVGTDAVVASYSGDSNYAGSSGMVSQIVNPVPTPVQFVPITPCRIVDTRNSNGTFGGPILAGRSTRSFPLTQVGNPCEIPPEAVAYSLNVAVVPMHTLSYLTIWPTGQGQPLVATLNSYDGRVKSNAAIVPAGTSSGAVSVYVTDTTHVILDINGYFMPADGSTLAYYPLAPCRVVDTRDANLPQGLGAPHFQSRETRELPFPTSACLSGIHNAKAYSINVAVVPNPTRTRLDYLTAFPSGQQRPVVATLNNPTATVVANAAIVPAAANGDISVYVTNSTDVIIDINGYFAAPGQGGLSFYPVTPCRVFDSRANNGQPFTHMLNPPVDVVHSQCGPPNTPAYVLNAVVVPYNGGPMGYLTLWADGEPRPLAANLNAYDGAVTSNMAIVPSENGSIDAYADGLTHLILDISGYFAP